MACTSEHLRPEDPASWFAAFYERLADLSITGPMLAALVIDVA